MLTTHWSAAQGDRVIVVSGDLKNLVGTVERVGDDGKVDVMPRMEGLTEVLTFDLPQLEKYFTVRTPDQGQLMSHREVSKLFGGRALYAKGVACSVSGSGTVDDHS